MGGANRREVMCSRKLITVTTNSITCIVGYPQALHAFPLQYSSKEAKLRLYCDQTFSPVFQELKRSESNSLLGYEFGESKSSLASNSAGMHYDVHSIALPNIALIIMLSYQLEVALGTRLSVEGSRSETFYHCHANEPSEAVPQWIPPGSSEGLNHTESSNVKMPPFYLSLNSQRLFSSGVSLGCTRVTK